MSTQARSAVLLVGILLMACGNKRSTPARAREEPAPQAGETPAAGAARSVLHVASSGKLALDGTELPGCGPDLAACLSVLDSNEAVVAGGLDLVADDDANSKLVLDVARAAHELGMTPVGLCASSARPPSCGERIHDLAIEAAATPPDSHPMLVMTVTRDLTVTVGAEVLGRCTEGASDPCGELAASVRHKRGDGSALLVQADDSLSWKSYLSVVRTVKASGAEPVLLYRIARRGGSLPQGRR